MIRTTRFSLTLMATVLAACGVARGDDPTPPLVKPAPSAGATAAEDDLRRAVDEMRRDMRELRRDVVKLREVLENREDGLTPAERSQFSDLVEEYNKLVKQDRWAEAELIAKQTKELARGRSERVSVLAMATIMYEKAHIGRQVARNAELKAAEMPSPPECTITDLDAAARLQAAKIHFSPKPPASERVENEMDLLKLAQFSRLWSEVAALKQRGKTDQFDAGCQQIRQAFPESEYAHRALDELATPANGRSSPPAAPAPIVVALKKPVSVHWNQLPLVEFAAAINKLGDINVVLDNAGLNEAAAELKTPISLSADQVPLADVLHRVLEPLKLDYLIKNEVLVISSRSRCRPTFEVRAYPVADLVTDSKTAAGAKVDFEPLIQLITSTVEPSSWAAAGGRGRVDSLESALRLVIRQSAAGHQQTSALLQKLRSMNGDVSLTAIIIDNPPHERDARDPESLIKPLSSQQMSEVLKRTRDNGWTVERTKLTLRFGAVASLSLQTPPSGDPRHDAITFESAISADRKHIGLCVGTSNLATGEPTRTSIETSIPNRQATLIALQKEHKLLIVIPEIGEEETETLTRP
jgi:hypothetical protein